jgi:methylthioribose-1-phosphate isomerase
MKRVIKSHPAASTDELRAALEAEALALHREDEEMGEQIGRFGADLFPNAATVLTHCNTGMLATGGKGTALAAVIVAWERKKLKHVYIDETRPLLQGARLTAWELKKSGIPHTLISDSTAAFLMQQGKVSTVIVGADRIAANGDVANKVGTFGLAVLARYHQIPFYVAAPSSSIDFEVRDGKAIPLEQRSGDELVIFGGRRIAPLGTEVYAPAFDITPHALISAIVTERGVLEPPYQISLCGVKHSGTEHREGMKL